VILKHDSAPESDYLIVSNELARDPNLSLQAKAIYIYLRSHREGWSMSVRRVAEALGVNKDTVGRYLDELEEAGYLIRTQGRDGKGRLGQSVYMTLSSPQSKNTASEKTGHGKTGHGETRHGKTGHGETRHGETRHGYLGTHKKTNSYKKTKEEEKTKDITPYRPPTGDSRPRAAAKTRNDYPEAFEQWWQTYPRRKNASKKDAHTQWKKAVKQIDSQRLLDLTAAYARDPGVSDPKYLPHPCRWPRDQRWESVDETNTGSVKQPQSSGIGAWLGFEPTSSQPDAIDAEIIDTKELPSWTG